MPKSITTKGRTSVTKPTLDSYDPARRGMPAKKSICGVVDHVSPQSVHYTILKTDETDEYDSIAKPKKKRRTKK